MTPITIICPEAHVGDANQLAMVLGESPADGLTFGVPGWQDDEGARYAAASLQVSCDWIAAAGRPLVRPIWDGVPYRINLTGAHRAQLCCVFMQADTFDAQPMKADAAVILMIAGVEPGVCVANAGLTRIAADGPA